MNPFFLDVKAGNRERFLFGYFLRKKIGGNGIEHFSIGAEHESALAKEEFLFLTLGYMLEGNGSSCLFPESLLD